MLPGKGKTETKATSKVISVELGAQLRNISGDHPAKFQETREVPKGLYVRNIDLKYQTLDSPSIFALKAREIRELDQRFTLDARRVGKYRAQFVWDQTPHYFGTGTTFLQQTSPGFYKSQPSLGRYPS